MKHLLTVLLIACFSIGLQAQTIKGRIIDSQSEMPLIGATVVVNLEAGQRGATTDIDGYYLLDQSSWSSSGLSQLPGL